VQLFAGRRLIAAQKSFDEFTFAANDHPTEPFEPSAIWDLRLSCKPLSEGTEILGRDLSTIHTIKQVLPQIAGKAVSADSRHEQGA
jgi:hypothetical protein